LPFSLYSPPPPTDKKKIIIVEQGRREGSLRHGSFTYPQTLPIFNLPAKLIFIFSSISLSLPPYHPLATLQRGEKRKLLFLYLSIISFDEAKCGVRQWKEICVMKMPEQESLHSFFRTTLKRERARARRREEKIHVLELGKLLGVKRRQHKRKKEIRRSEVK
jgi:hypothetical protein